MDPRFFRTYEMVEKNQGYRNPILELSSSSFKYMGDMETYLRTTLKLAIIWYRLRYISHQRALHAFRCVRNLGW